MIGPEPSTWHVLKVTIRSLGRYVSTSPDFSNPAFVNSGDGAGTALAIDLQPGTYYFTLFGESAFTPIPADVQFVMNLYVDGNQSSAGISGMYGAGCPTVCAAGHANSQNITGTAFSTKPARSRGATAAGW